MERYSEYKDSGVQWIGEIPSHWKLYALKYILQEKKEIVGSFSYKYDLLSLTLRGIIKRNMDNPTGKFPSSFDIYKIVRRNDFVFCNFDNEETPRAVGLSNYEGMITGAYDVFSCKRDDVSNRFLLYLFLSIDNRKQFKPLYKGLRKTIPLDSFMSYKIAIPPFLEQQSIADYLDKITLKIDEAIAQQQKMIDLLNERKQIIINNAVTKGLNPDVPMKDSGVDWIGEIPEHWDVMKTLFTLSMPITDGPHETPLLYDNGIPFVSAEAVSMGNGGINFNHIRGYISKAFYDECCKKYIPQKYDIYMIKSGATTGKVAIVETDVKFTIWSPLAVFRCNQQIMNPNYLFFVLQSNFYQFQVQLGWSYGTQQNIGMRTLEKLKVTVPPVCEQIIIADKIKEELVPINNAIKVANKQIILLQERKQIIINDVVTGKVKIS